MLLGLIWWAVRQRRADVLDAVARLVWAAMGAALLILLGVQDGGDLWWWGF